MSTPISHWLTEQRSESGLTVEQVPFSACRHWNFVEGALRHTTGKFFSVIGILCYEGPPHLKGLALPIIDQPEVGILGFVVRRTKHGWEWLLQAKTEPGNVHGTQVGPSVQATLSNYQQVHGGRPTEMIELFTEGRHIIGRYGDVEQSEQGDRFLGKYNRNAVVEVDAQFPAPACRTWRWFTAEEVRHALVEDFTFNTDARSVLCCTHWSLLCDPGNVPFGRWRSQGGFGEKLFISSQVPLNASGYDPAIEVLAHRRAIAGMKIERVPLQLLKGWRCDGWAIESSEPPIDPVVRAFRVHSADREVQEWWQPLLTNRNEGQAVLVCTQRDGHLQFLLNPSAEPGFIEHVQFAPSLLTGMGHDNPSGLADALIDRDAMCHLSVLQSDEGGRFKDSVARYQIVEIPPERACAFDGAGAWVSLSGLSQMASQRGLLSNELRSCISLLLSWA